MGKKNISKTLFQKDALEEYYSRPGMQKWKRKNIESFANSIGLNRQKVYKWMWDKRNAWRVKQK